MPLPAARLPISAEVSARGYGQLNGYGVLAALANPLVITPVLTACGFAGYRDSSAASSAGGGHCSLLIPRHGSQQGIVRHKAMLFLAFLIGYEEFIGKPFSDS